MLLFLAKALSKLPLSVLQVLGGAIGWLVYWLSPAYRRRMQENMALAGLRGASLQQRAAIETGKQMLEAVWIWLRPDADLRTKFDLSDNAAENAVLALKGPVVFLSPHLGSFECIPPRYMLLRGDTHPLTVLYRVPRKPILRPLLEAGRERYGIQMAPADMRGVRKLMRALRDKETVGILPDQVPSHGDGVWAPFFGKPAYTMTLPLRLAHLFKAPVMLVIAERLPRGRGFRVYIERLEGLTGELERDVAAMNRAIEALILRFPTQYLWGYNRYKKPQRAPDAPPVESAG